MNEAQQYAYATYLGIKFPPLALVDVPALLSGYAIQRGLRN